MPETFYKTTYTFWTTYPTNEVELVDLAHEATSGDAIAEGGSHEVVSQTDVPEAVASFFNLEEQNVA